MESIKTGVEGGLHIEWKAFSLEQQNSTQGPAFVMWEHPEFQSQGMRALVAAKAAKNQGESFFMKFHLATFQARHEQGKDIADRMVLKGIAESIGLDMERFEEDMKKNETWQAVGKDHTESKVRYDVFGVPTLVFGPGRAFFVKLEFIPESLEEKIDLFKFISNAGENMPFLLELKRPPG